MANIYIHTYTFGVKQYSTSIHIYTHIFIFYSAFISIHIYRIHTHMHTPFYHISCVEIFFTFMKFTSFSV